VLVFKTLFDHDYHQRNGWNPEIWLPGVTDWNESSDESRDISSLESFNSLSSSLLNSVQSDLELNNETSSQSSDNSLPKYKDCVDDPPKYSATEQTQETACILSVDESPTDEAKEVNISAQEQTHVNCIISIDAIDDGTILAECPKEAQRNDHIVEISIDSIDDKEFQERKLVMSLFVAILLAAALIFFI